VGAGAEDVQNDGERWHIITPIDVLETVREALASAKVEIASASLSKLPKLLKTLTGNEAPLAMSLVEALEDNDDVQKVYTDFELSEEALAAIS
jgi:transcriptional/translational regulatory protein YebC/TACO1